MLTHSLYRRIVYPLYHWVKRDGVNKAIRELNTSEWYSREELENLQRRKLGELLDFAYKNVPYYRQILGATGLPPWKLAVPENFRRIPVVTKEIIRKDIGRLMATDLRGNGLEKNSTSGSTGESLFFYTDFRSSAYRKAAVIRNKRWTGFRLGDREISLWGSPIDEDRASRLWGRLHDLITGHRFLSSFDLTEDRMDAYVDFVRQFRPLLMVSYPGPLEVFTHHCRARQIAFESVKSIISSAETLWPYQRTLFEEVFRARVFDRYGCREVGDIAQECEARCGLHVNSDHVFVEILDAKGNPCAPGQVGELYVTDLDNYGMPFIRYQIGDTAAWADRQDCPCGRRFPLLAQIEGRSMDIVTTPSGKRLGGTFWTILFRTRPGIKQFQLVQEDLHTVTVRFVRDAMFQPEALDYFTEKIRKTCGADLRVNFVEVSYIDTTISGKRRLIISKCS